MSALREAVSVAVGLRELATYEPVDTRARCDGCGLHTSATVHVVETWRGKIDGELDLCKSCCIKRGVL